jgi:mannose-6-phosphate isomerase-like protein (cupin superfamily)
MTEVIDIESKFNLINEYWSPNLLGEVNDSCVKIAKFKNSFDWHSHPEEDEMFLIIKGEITIHLRDKDLHLKPGQCVIISRGVEHKPVAQAEAWVMMFEPKSTVNTGDNILSKHTKTEIPAI